MSLADDAFNINVVGCSGKTHFTRRLADALLRKLAHAPIDDKDMSRRAQ